MRITVEHLRGIEWGRAYSWDLRIPDAPSPFDSWFPAFDVQETIYDITTRDFEVGNIQLSVPEITNLKKLQITFYDDDRSTIHQFMEDWVFGVPEKGGKVKGGMFPNREYVRPLSECVKDIIIRRFDSTGLLTRRTATYSVFPSGGFTFNGKSESEAVTNTIEFTVVGEDIEAKRTTGFRIPVIGEISSIGRIGEALM